MKPGLVAALVLAAGLVLASCGDRRDADGPSVAGDEAVATVNGQNIWASDVKREAVAQGLIAEGEPLDTSSDLFRRVLDEVIDQKLLAAEAVQRGLQRDPSVRARVRAARDRILGDVLVENVVSSAVNENAIRTLYAEQLKLAQQSEEIRARQIVLATEAEAETVKSLIAAGASFEALAMERSVDAATRFNGGDLGYFTTDVMPEAYDAALASAPKGEVVGPFPVEGGFALVKVEDRRMEEPITLEAARPQIVRFLTYDQVRDLLERLRGRARIEVKLPAPQDVPGRPVEPDDAPPPLAGSAEAPAAKGEAAPPAAQPAAKAAPAAKTQP